jgi:hypothetical protein
MEAMMTERTTKRAARGERHTMVGNVEHLREAAAAMWSPALTAPHFSDAIIGWNEKALEHMKTGRDLGSALGMLARRQGKLMMEVAQSFELDAAADDRGPRGASVKIRTDKVDHIFDEASDILREAGHIMAEAQINALNWLRPLATEGNPRLIASVEDHEAA